MLGCTHYPLLAQVIERAAERAFGHPVRLVDSATAMASVAAETLAARGQLEEGRGSLGVFVTDASRLDELAPRFLGEQLGSFETVDL